MPRPSLLQKLLDLPAFLVGVFILYWSVPLAVLQGKLQFWNLFGKRDDAFGWAAGLQTSFGIRILQLPGPDLYRAENVVYLANHRSWADFFIDVIMTDGRAQMLSRLAVLLVFPAFMCCVWALKSVVLFKRGAKVDKEKFNDMIDQKLLESPVQGLIVYPEGHRSTRRESLPLKRGMLHYCYDRKRSVQVIITANKEAVLSEKDLRCHLGQSVLVGYSQPLHPADHPSFEAFMAAVQKSWDAEWRRVYGTKDWKGASQRRRPSSLVHDYPLRLKLLQIGLQGSSCLFFLVTVYWTLRAAFAALSLTGSYKGIVASILAIWWAASLARAFIPVRLPPPERPAAPS